MAKGVRFLLENVHPDERKQFERSLAMLARKKDLIDAEYRFKRRDGKWIWLRTRVTRAHEEGGIQYYQGITSDITASKETEERILRKNRELVVLNDIANAINQSYDW